MLGRLRMSTEEALHEYDRFARDIFAASNRNLFKVAEKFGAERLQEAIEAIVAKRGARDTMLDPSFEGQKGKAFVCALPANQGQNEPHRFRTYDAENARYRDIKIWEAARATTAAPRYFKPLSITRNFATVVYLDAAIGCNNPTEELIDEAGRVFPTRIESWVVC